MSRPLIQMNLYCTTNADANNVRNAVEARILTNPARSLAEPTVVIAWHRNIQLVNSSVWCPDVADAIALFDEVVASWTQGPQSGRIRADSWVKRWTNREDEGLPDILEAQATK
jgi:hypothetical protein